MQPEAAVVKIEKVISARCLLEQDVALLCVNLFPDGACVPFVCYLADKPLAFVTAFDPHLALALRVVSEPVVSDVHTVGR